MAGNRAYRGIYIVGLVLALSGCWHFSSPDEQPPVEKRVPSDARRRDATPADAAEPDEELASVPPPRRVPRVDAGVFAVPPGCVRGRVIAMTLRGSPSDVVLTIGAGANQGVSRSWTARLDDAAQTPVRIIRVDKAVTVVTISGVTIDSIRSTPIVVLCP